MQERHLFEYAVIRIVPRVERGEYINAGVVLYCRKQSFLNLIITIDEARLIAMFPAIELDDIKIHLAAFEEICCGKKSLSPIAALDLPSRFRWLTARRSTVIQASEVHPGLCINASATLASLYNQLVAL